MYELLKDLLLPLLGPTVGIVVPTIFFFILPRRRERQKMAFELFATFNVEEFRRSRLEVWTHFVTQTASSSAEQNQRLDQYLDYLTADARLSPETLDLFMKATRVLDFFALVERCIRQRLVNEELIGLFLANPYLWWRDKVLVPLRQRRQIENESPRIVPLWWHPFAHLDRVVGVAELPSAFTVVPVASAGDLESTPERRSMLCSPSSSCLS